MRARDNIALNLSPVPIRAALACIFLWAGLGKIIGTMEVSGPDAATLANLGVQFDTGAMAPPPPDPATPDDQSSGPSGPRVVLAAQDDRYTASDFPDPVETLKVNGLVLLMNAAADDGRFDADGNPMDPIWLGWAGHTPWVRVLAWAAAIVEVLFGFLVLIGLFTRLGALNLGGVMLVAMWLTEIGPAVQAGTAQVGFLPGHEVFDTAAWTPFFFQFSVLAAAGTLLLLGPGSISVDAMAFAKKPEPDEYDEEEEEEDE